LTASLGRRTKYQHTDYAQLFLFARSNLVHRDGSKSSAHEAEDTEQKPDASSSVVQGTELSFDAVSKVEPVIEHEICTDNQTSGWQHAKWELGRRLVNEAEGGEEAAVREVLLDNQDGGAAENILLEGGPQFAEGSKHDKGGQLHPIDQAILLALCLDVHNSNADHALTYEEMYPYIERVLLQANNWMVHSTALLERSWLEFERRKTMDRAMLQIQALIDQHSSKLSISQASYESVESAAPVQDRLMYLHSIVYGAQYELKRDLANRYLRCQVFVSAMNFFKELEMWDEVVTCYQLLQKPQRAELVVREQLKTGETPYMLTALADLTGKEEYYERAWIVSKGRYPRAKRTQAKICYDRGDFAKCCQYLDEALAVQPLVATAWYLKGIACMRLERWDDGVQAFVRCVQQDMEIGEAWANIGAIHMQQRAWAKAHPALTEALKVKRESWRILENLMTVCIAMGRWREVVLHMNALLDLRLKSDRPVHVDELRHLAYIVANVTQKEARVKLQKELEERRLLQAESTEPLALEEVVMVREMPDLAVHVEKLIVRITNTIKSDPEVWDILAEFQHTLGRFDLELEARIKQVSGGVKFLSQYLCLPFSVAAGLLSPAGRSLLPS
jgi:tetratricopeptide (TPR) repeat protein